MNREVNISKREKTAQGWSYCHLVLASNGRIKPDFVILNGKQEQHPEGAYYIDWREGGQAGRCARHAST